MNLTKRFRSGFTLIELLTVIAIIAVLAALLFPVFSRVRESVRQSSCFTNMHDIYRAAKLYKEDNNRYPASLLGFVQLPVTDVTTNNKPRLEFYIGPTPTAQPHSTGLPVPPAQLDYLPLTNGQKYLKDVNVFACPDTKDKEGVTNAVYPSAPNIQHPGEFVHYTDSIMNGVNMIGHNTGYEKDQYFQGYIAVGIPPIYYYSFDSYDTGPKLNPDGTATPGSHELHYSLDWTGGSGSSDPRNQLKYGQNAPEDSTVLTWCTEHVANGSADKVLVLMLSGKTVPVDARLFAARGPLNYAP